jgi:Uma2 family endonuclease
MKAVKVATPPIAKVPKYSFSVAQYERMGEIGIFREGDRVELIGGEIIEMSPIGRLHAACVDALSEVLRERLQRTVNIRIQNPIRLDDDSEPQPDIAVLKRRDDFYRGAHPKPEDVLLLIEVAETSLAYDREAKLPLYAFYGIREVWIVNLAEERIETYADPVEGVYETSASYGRGEEIQSGAVAALKLNVSEVLG